MYRNQILPIQIHFLQSFKFKLNQILLKSVKFETILSKLEAFEIKVNILKFKTSSKHIKAETFQKG